MSLIIALAFALASAPAASGDSIGGRWINPAKSVIIAITPCGTAQCGVVEWASAEAKADARKGAPNLVGTSLLTDLAPKGTGQWEGKLFIPDKKMHVTAKIQRAGENQLKVTGCAVGGILCDSQVWSASDGAPPTD